MAELSENARILLATIKSQGTKYDNMGTYFTDALVAYWYHSKHQASALEEADKAAIQELLDNGLARTWQRKKDEYELTPKGEAYSPTHAASSSSVQNVFSGNFHQSPIANMSADVRQNLDLSIYSLEVQKEVAALQEAFESNDDTRAKRIIDGLWISAPQLVLSLMQVGLSMSGVANS